MLVSMNWIKEFVDLDHLEISLENLIQKFTLSTAEVEKIIYKGRDIQKVVSGKIISIEKHPNSKKLNILKIDTGYKIHNCVCGASNVALNQIVAFAMAGGKVVHGEINKTTVAGYESEGMCCSESELGISDDDSGLMILPPGTKLGVDIKELYPEIEDVIFEIDNKSLTNRPDLWGHYGIAREFAALSGSTLKSLDIYDGHFQGSEHLEVEIARKDLVNRYSCVKIGNITKNTSPTSMRIRLFYCGIRSINLMADLTNYIMLELGQPMHAFDARKINNIILDIPNQNTKLVTLDGIERDITNSLLIYTQDHFKNRKPVAVAGIIGSKNSEVGSGTTQIVLESANFDPTYIRKSGNVLGLRTDARTRFEKTLDPELTEIAIRRFIKLLSKIDSKFSIESNLKDVYIRKYPEISLILEAEYLKKYTGIDISSDVVCNILMSLGFDVNLGGQNYKVRVPSWRATKDVTITADVIEEISRIYGYANFESTPTRAVIQPIKLDLAKSEENEIKDILVEKFKLHEVHSYIWCDEKKYKEIGIHVESNVEILNTPTPENKIIRDSLIPNSLVMVYENRLFNKSFGIFEVARIVDGLSKDGACNEKRKLGIILFDKELSEKELYFKSIGIVKHIFNKLKHSEVEFQTADVVKDWQHPKNSINISYQGENLGTINTLHPRIISKIDKNASIVCLEIDLDNMSNIKREMLEYSEPSKFPGIDIDLCLDVKNTDTKYSEIKKTWELLNLETLIGVTLLDTYKNSITIRLHFSSTERTLSMEKVKQNIDKIIEHLYKINVLIRQ